MAETERLGFLGRALVWVRMGSRTGALFWSADSPLELELVCSSLSATRSMARMFRDDKLTRS